MRVLLLEHDPALRRLLDRQLVEQGWQVDPAEDPDELPGRVEGGYNDMVVIDLSVGNALRVLERVRAVSRHIPVIVISANTDVSFRIDALNLGADDVVVKPFTVREFLARVRALLRRSNLGTSSVLRVKDLELDRVNRLASRSGRQIDLTPKEFRLVEYLMLNAGQRVTRAMITRDVWNFSPDANSNVVEVYINYVRKKIDSQSSTKLIHTIRGVGYQIGDPIGAESKRPPDAAPAEPPTARRSAARRSSQALTDNSGVGERS